MNLRSSRHSFWRRTAIGLLAVFQLGAAIAVPAVDAVLEAQEIGASAHFETQGSDHGCHTGHDHLICQLVRSMGQATLSPSVRSVPAVRPKLKASFVGTPTQFDATDRVHSSQGPRAPPA